MSKADITFIIIDFKFNKTDKLKVCEIQNGLHSQFTGSYFLNPDYPIIPEKFVNYMDQFNVPCHTVFHRIQDSRLRSTLKSSKRWKKHFPKVKLKRSFANDSSDIRSYKNIVFSSINGISNSTKTSGALIMDRAINEFWVDKEKMSRNFDTEILREFKPRWGVYPKVYSKNLSQTIINELECDTFVIKPLSSFLGNGVIIVSKEELDDVLKKIITNAKELKDNPDNSFSYWSKDNHDSLVVEQFIESDPVTVNGQIKDPTMRSVIMMSYSKGEIDIEIFETYGMLPKRTEGTLNEIHKSYVKPPYFYKIETQLKEEIESYVTDLSAKFYKQILQLS